MQNPTYIQNCNNFSEAMNKLFFEVRVPEYYVTAIPSYFTRGPQKPKPIVNGVEVEWDEYLEKHPDYEDNSSFTPSTIYKGMDMNMCISFKNIPELIDMIVNQVPFDIVNFRDLGCMLGIMDGYNDEVSAYEALSVDLQLFLKRMRQARGVINLKYEEMSTYYRNTDPAHHERPTTLVDILKQMSVNIG